MLIVIVVLQLVILAALAAIWRRITSTGHAVVAVAQATAAAAILNNVAKGEGRSALVGRLATHPRRHILQPEAPE